MAAFTESERKYRIRFVNEDGTELSVTPYAYGTSAEDIAKPDDPTKVPTTDKTFAFSGWTPEIADVTADATYTATYDEAAREYAVTFVNDDVTQISSASYAYGTKAEDIAKPDNPTKAPTEGKTFAFSGWTPEIADVTTDATYTAVFTSIPKATLTVIWLNGDGTQLDSKTYTEGQDEPATDKVPAKESDAANTYTFSKWDSGTTEGNVKTYAPEFTATSQSSTEYSVTVNEGSGSGQYKEGDSVSIIANDAPDGQVFDKWLGADGLTFTNGNQNSANATFTMPGNDVTLTATSGEQSSQNNQGCYVATSVYGTYDCPEVWTLRRFRDNVLAKTWYGRLFIRLYYAVSPTAVKLFGDSEWFQNFFRDRLDKMVSGLQADGFESTPYQDLEW